MSYTRTVERKPTPRIWVGFAEYTTANVANAVTGAKVATGSFTSQLRTGDGGFGYLKSRESSLIENQQDGVIDVCIDREDATVELTLSSQGLNELRWLAGWNTYSSAGHSANIVVDKESRGYYLSANKKVLSLFVIDKNKDPDNDSNSISATSLGDSEAILIPRVVVKEGTTIKYNAERDVFTIIMQALAHPDIPVGNSARGVRMIKGTFTGI